MRPTATCELWLDGTRVPDDAPDLAAGNPTALSGLTLGWGRDGPHEQPGPATMVVDILDQTAAADFLDQLHVGSAVAVWSEAHFPGPPGGGYAQTMDDGTLDTYQLGPFTPYNLILLHPSNATAVAGNVITYSGRGRVAELTGDYGPNAAAATHLAMLAPPRPCSPPATLPDAWDDIPQRRPGDPAWQISFDLWVPAGVRYRPYIGRFTAPYYPTGLVGISNGGNGWATSTGAWTTVTTLFSIDDTGPVWLAPGVNIEGFEPAIWANATGTWADHPERWADQLQIRALVDNFFAGPPAGDTLRRLLAFSGAVSDVKAVPDPGGGLLYTVTAADLAADLGNKVIGDDPWPAQTLTVRAERIAELAGIPKPPVTPRVRIDPPLGALSVSYRDVDAQPASALLQDLATTGGGVLWAATHAVTGPFLWIENPDRRTAVAELTLTNGFIMVTGATADTTVISACDVLLDGVEWLQDTQDVSTVVAVGWLEQTLDDAGLAAPTERTVTVYDTAAARTKYGTRRLSISTELTASLDASNYANRALIQARAVGWRVEGITLDTAWMPDTVAGVDDTARLTGLCNLLDGTTRMGLALTLVDMPAYAPRGTVSSYYLEGGRYSYTAGRWSLELAASPSPGQGSSAQWGQLDAAWRWNQWTPALKWSDLYGVAP